MIHVRRSKASKAPEDNFTAAHCDVCEAECRESRQPGRTGRRAHDPALAAAVEAGWSERTVIDRAKRKRLAWVVQLLCPRCQLDAVSKEMDSIQAELAEAKKRLKALRAERRKLERLRVEPRGTEGVPA